MRVLTGRAINWRHPLNRGLLVRYRCLPNQQRGVMWRDLCRRYDGTLTNTPEWRGKVRPNQFGSLYFDGASAEYVACPVPYRTTYSVSCWFAVGATGFYGLWRYSQMGCILDRTNPISFQNHVTFETQAATVGIAANSAYFITITHLDDTAGGSKIYLNGADVTSTASVTKTGNVTLEIGKSDAGFWMLNGRIDDFCIWDRVLSASEVASLYRAQSSQLDPTLNWLGIGWGLYEQPAAPVAAPSGDGLAWLIRRRRRHHAA